MHTENHPFLGQVDAMHPLRLIDPDYRHHKTDDHVVADTVLERPGALLSRGDAPDLGWT